MVVSGINTDPGLPEDAALDSLDQRIAAARKAEAGRLTKFQPDEAHARTVAYQVAQTMIGYPLGGAIIGWGLDQALGTRPWLMIVLMFMAFAGACTQALRITSRRRDAGANQGKDL